jgi:Domain of unknown function(DUF2779)
MTDRQSSYGRYLADPKRDCRLERAQRLLNDLQGSGSIIVYTNFERTNISNLAAAFPQLGAELNLLVATGSSSSIIHRAGQAFRRHVSLGAWAQLRLNSLGFALSLPRRSNLKDPSGYQHAFRVKSPLANTAGLRVTSKVTTAHEERNT